MDNGYETLEEREKRIFGRSMANNNTNDDTADNNTTNNIASNSTAETLADREKRVFGRDMSEREQQQNQQAQPTQQPQQQKTPPPQQKPNLFDTVKNVAGQAANAAGQAINNVGNFLNNEVQQLEKPKEKQLDLSNVHIDPVKKKAQDAYLSFPSFFDNPDKISAQSATQNITPDVLQHMAYQAENKYTDPISKGIAMTNDFLSYHPKALETLADVQNSMADVGKFLDKKFGNAEFNIELPSPIGVNIPGVNLPGSTQVKVTGKDVEQVGSGFVNAVGNMYLGSSQTVKSTLDQNLPKPITQGEVTANTIGQVLGSVASFVAGGEVLKAAQFTKGSMPLLFGALGFTSAPPDTTFAKRLTIAAVNALGGKYFEEAGAAVTDSGLPKEALKSFAKVQGINAAVTGLTDAIEGKKPKEVLQDVATSSVILGLFHIVGTAQGLLSKQVSDLKSGEVPQAEVDSNLAASAGDKEGAFNTSMNNEAGSLPAETKVDPSQTSMRGNSPGEDNILNTRSSNRTNFVSRFNDSAPSQEHYNKYFKEIQEQETPLFDGLNKVAQDTGSEAVYRMKSQTSLETKLARKPGRTLGTMNDTLGSTLVAKTPEDIQGVIDSAKKHLNISNVDDFRENPTFLGYKAVHMDHELPNGAIAEVQVNTKDGMYQKEYAHEIYDKWRKYIESNGNTTIDDVVGSIEKDHPEKVKEFLNDVQLSKDIYDGKTEIPQQYIAAVDQKLQDTKGKIDTSVQEAQATKDANAALTFQSKETQAKQAEFNTQLDTIRNSSTDQADLTQKVTDLVGKTLDQSGDDRASVMGLRTALNKEMQGIVGDHGSFKKNYAMLKYMQGSDSDAAAHLSTLEDHVALLDNVLQNKAFDDFARTFGKVPTDLPESNQSRGSVTLHGGIPIVNPELGKFIKDDVVPYSKETISGMQKAFDEVKTWFSPTSKAPKEALDTIMTRKGEMEQSQFRAEQATKDIKNMWDRQDENARLEFMQQVETGGQLSEKYQPIADFYKERLDNAHKTITKYKDINFLENFFPHFWEKPEDMQKFMAQQASRRPFEGTKSFLKQRVFETIKEGMDAGYTPVSTNPEELMQIYEQNVRKFAMAQDIKNDLIKKGFWQFVKAGEKVPDGFTKINDKIVKVYFPPDIAEVTINGNETKKMVEAGEFYAHEDVARLINNYLSPDLIMDTAIGKGLMNVKNTMNAFQLGLSAFHGTMETLDSIITHGSIGFSKIINEGKVFRGLADIATSAVAPVKYFRDGQKFYNGDPELMKIEQDLFTGGASLKNKQYFKNTVYDTFLQRIREGNIVGAAVRSPLATIEAAMRPLMSYYIPRLKIGAFRHLFASELERNSGKIASGEMTREELARKTWSNVENRMGELNYDNLFWNRTFKSSMMLGTRAVGWNLGTAREIGGGVFADTPQQLMNITKGKMPELTPKMAYTVNLLFTTAAIGSIYQYLHTGKGPQGLLDMFYPENGATDKNNDPVRVQFPTYLKDMYAATHHPVKMVSDKFAPELSSLLGLLNNKDYYGNYIRNEHDNLPDQTKQVAAYLISQVEPFSIQSIKQQAQGKANIPQQLENFLGIQKAPIDTIKTDKERRLQQAATDQLGAPGPQTPEQQHIAELKTEARKDIVAGKKLHDSAAFMELYKSGIIKTRTQAENFVKTAGMTPDQRLFQHLSKDRKVQVLQEGK